MLCPAGVSQASERRMFIEYFEFPVLFLLPNSTVIIIVQEMMRRVRRLWLIYEIQYNTRLVVRHRRPVKLDRLAAPVLSKEN